MELISIIIGLAGFLFGAYAFYKNRAVKELTVIYSNQLIEGKSKPGVEMLYLGEPVSDFMRYEITLFNSGKGVLRPVDFKKPLAVSFENLQIVSQHPHFSSDGVEPEFQVSEQEIGVDFKRLRRNDYIRFEVLTGAHSKALTPPLVQNELFSGKPLKVHQQVFDEESNNKRYQALVRHLAAIGGAFFVGVLLLAASFYSKYQVLFVDNSLALRDQMEILLRIESLPWFGVFILALILLAFAYESLKVLSAKFRRYKFEQFIQNEH